MNEPVLFQTADVLNHRHLSLATLLKENLGQFSPVIVFWRQRKRKLMKILQNALYKKWAKKQVDEIWPFVFETAFFCAVGICRLQARHLPGQQMFGIRRDHSTGGGLYRMVIKDTIGTRGRIVVARGKVNCCSGDREGRSSSRFFWTSKASFN